MLENLSLQPFNEYFCTDTQFSFYSTSISKLPENLLLIWTWKYETLISRKVHLRFPPQLISILSRLDGCKIFPNPHQHHLMIHSIHSTWLNSHLTLKSFVEKVPKCMKNWWIFFLWKHLNHPRIFMW